MRGDFPAFAALYSNAQRIQAVQAALIEAEGYGRWTRLREIAEFAHRIEARPVGVAHCTSTAREAGLVARYLRDSGLEVVMPGRSEECNPLAQAALLADRDTKLNVICGMSVAHEAMFIRASAVPVTVLVARDARLRHNPVAALYTSDGYSQNLLYGQRRRPESPFRGGHIAALECAGKALPEAVSKEFNRLQEVMEFAHCLGATHIGVSFCVGFRAEARVLTRILEANGFRVSSACCKSGAVSKETLGLNDSQKVRPGQPEMMCNPLAQGALLNGENVQLAVILGQCVGHDSATIGQLNAPTVCLVAKDRVLAHNTVAALYELES
ncbi:MAG: hypothetical protein AMS18_02395 [Gemmatimonas sp. SG8_17]|nr:MAG: hypothetical protein AMS18_02395 [Gemmatimonas sp. SG8_17]